MDTFDRVSYLLIVYHDFLFDYTYNLYVPAIFEYTGTIILPNSFFQSYLFSYVSGADCNALFFTIRVK